MNGDCRLCKRENIELRNSHLIPEFNYAHCYDHKHRFHRLSTAGPTHQRFEQKGHREHLLCQECETKLSRWEGYAKRILNDDGLRLVHRNENGYVLAGADYHRLRLYCLSLIWRMGVSTLKMFREVRLGPHGERIRQALLDEDPLDPHQYPCLLTAVTINGKFHPDLIVPPSLAKTDGQHVYRVVISGIVYCFYVGSQRVVSELEQMALTREGILKIAVMPIEEISYLLDHVLQVCATLKKSKLP